MLKPILLCLALTPMAQAFAEDQGSVGDDIQVNDPVHAPVGARAELDRFLSGLESLSGTFEQLTEDADAVLLERSTGTFAVRAPDRFRWDYVEPFPQVIVADGQAVWIHDIELEQVSVRPQSGDGSDSPLALLANPELLDQQYAVSERAGQTHAWLVLRPQRPDSQFSEVELGLVDGKLRRMVMRDGFGQVTDIRFTTLARNPDLPPATFEFTPPPGADVLGERPLLEPRTEPLIRPLPDDGTQSGHVPDPKS